MKRFLPQIHRFLFLFFILHSSFCILHSFAQTKEELEKKKQKLLEDIDLTNELLNKTKESKWVSLNELETIEKKITIREELISNIRTQISILNKSIDKQSKIINALDRDLKAIKKEYAKMIYYAYKNQSAYNKLLFIFAAQNFNDAYRRIKYLKRYAEYRRIQANLIIHTQKDLETKVKELEAKKKVKQELLGNETEQKSLLNQEVQEKNKVVKGLQKKEKQLLADLKEKQKKAERLNKAIEDIIRKEIEEARRKAEEAERAKAKEKGIKETPKTTGLGLTPEAAALSENFANNQGKLPWPVERGVITETFGTHEHPILKGVKTSNNGVTIKTNEGTSVRAVFEGKVVSVVFNPSFQKAVIIQHGEYYSVYSNLDNVTVKSGDNVTTKQSIGNVYTDESESKTEVHLEIWKGTTKLNPSHWIANQ